jgi:hypothetical protein
VHVTITTFAQPRYEVNGRPSDGEEAVRELLQGMMREFPDLRLAPTVKLRRADDGDRGSVNGTL